ncbi:MAG: hypothetical protein ACRC0S_02170 [Fusobacteriaceae bacterium]
MKNYILGQEVYHKKHGLGFICIKIELEDTLIIDFAKEEGLTEIKDKSSLRIINISGDSRLKKLEEALIINNNLINETTHSKKTNLKISVLYFKQANIYKRINYYNRKNQFLNRHWEV